MRCAIIVSAIAAFSAYAAAFPQEVPTTTCDATKCAREIVKVLGKAAACSLEKLGKSSGTEPGSDILCANLAGDLRECTGCNVKQRCDINDKKAFTKACGPGSGLQLGLCADARLSAGGRVVTETDAEDGDFVFHCDKRPSPPAGTTTNGGTCIFDCSQCDPCIRDGKSNVPFEG